MSFAYQRGPWPDPILPVSTKPDARRTRNGDAIAAGNIEIVQEIRKHSPDTPIVINSLLPRGGAELQQRSPDWKVLQDANHELACYVKDQDNVYFFNATDYFVYHHIEGNTTEIYVNKTLMPDFLHPSGYGAMKWGKGISDFVVELISDSESLLDDSASRSLGVGWVFMMIFGMCLSAHLMI